MTHSSPRAAGWPRSTRAVHALAWLLVALPLLGAAVLLLGGRRTDRVGLLLAVGMSWASFVVGLVVLIQLVGLPAGRRSRAAADAVELILPAPSSSTPACSSTRCR